MGRASQALTILPSLSRAVVTKSRTVKNPRARGGIFNFDYSSPTSAPTVGPTFAVEGLAAGTTADQWYTIAAVGTTDSTSTGLRRIVIYPGISTADISAVGIEDQEVVSMVLPSEFRVTSTSASTGTCAFSVGVDLVE
jgi:hypothetical protein